MSSQKLIVIVDIIAVVAIIIVIVVIIIVTVTTIICSILFTAHVQGSSAAARCIKSA